MANGKGKVFAISLALPSATVGKFAKWSISQEAQVGTTCPLCRLPPMAKVSLPSAADGKEPLPSPARKQTAKQLFTVAFFAGAFYCPRLTAKVFAVRLSSLCRPPWQTAK